MQEHAQSSPLRHALAPSAADVNFVTVHAVDGMEGAYLHAATAVVARLVVADELFLDKARRMDGAFLDARIAPAAQLGHGHGHSLSDDADVVEVGLHAVVGAAAHRDLELVGKGDAAVPLIKEGVQLFRKGEGIDEPVLAGRALARDDGPHLCARAARLQPALLQKGDERFRFFIGDALDLAGEAHGHGDLSVAEFLCRLRNGVHLLRGDLPVCCDDADVEAVRRRLVAQKTEPFEAGHFRLGHGALGVLRGVVVHKTPPILFGLIYSLTHLRQNVNGGGEMRPFSAQNSAAKRRFASDKRASNALFRNLSK